MSVKLKIRVTKDILERSKRCGENFNESEEGFIGKNCAIALAVRDIFPSAYVSSYGITPFSHLKSVCDNYIKLPHVARNFITAFDSLCGKPEQRAAMPELEFEVEVMDEVIERINISEITPILENHPTLQLTGIH